VIQCRDKTYPFVTSVTEGTQRCAQGDSLFSSAADEIVRGTTEDHVKPLDNWQLFVKTFRPSVRLSVTAANVRNGNVGHVIGDFWADVTCSTSKPFCSLAKICKCPL
jgi:hypothetical protein